MREYVLHQGLTRITGREREGARSLMNNRLLSPKISPLPFPVAISSRP